MHASKCHNPVPMRQQLVNFEFNLKLASDFNKPLVLHSRDTVKQCLDICKQRLRDPTTHQIHLHCFQGDAANLAPYTSMKNLKVGITNAVWSNSRVEATVRDFLSTSSSLRQMLLTFLRRLVPQCPHLSKH